MAMANANLLKHTDGAVGIFQDLITILANYYEEELKEVPNSPTPSFSAPNLEIVQITFRKLSEMLACLWPCEKQFVAVFGPTGCGKSTLLNVLLSMICSTGEAYLKEIKLDSYRAALRETAKQYGSQHASKTIVDLGVAESDSKSSSENALSGFYNNITPEDDASSPLNLDMEKDSLSGLLGIFCAKNRESYVSCHMANYDRHPFLLLNGRLGDAGTTKVTAIEYGPKFVGRIRWIGRQKLRKQFRELRQLMDTPEHSSAEDNKLEELKELWRSVLNMVKHNCKSSLPYPDEQLINTTLSTLSQTVPFGQEEVIENSVPKGCILDRLRVRDSIYRRLRHQKLGLFAEDLKLEVPVSSFEGGIGLLDVPGTNDPRKLHQREIWHATDRAALILFVLDKSVIDTATEKILEESPILEKVLLDDTDRCSLIVVGIAEKDNRGNQSSLELTNNFDLRGTVWKTLEMIIRKKVKQLIRIRRISKEVAMERVNKLFSNKDRLCILPVLPCLCAAVHLSSSNPKLHKSSCERSNPHGCPSEMGRELLRMCCLQTNMPQLLERIHAVRLPPSPEHLHAILKSAESMVNVLLQESPVDATLKKFLQTEHMHAEGRKPETIYVNDFPKNAIDDSEISKLLDQGRESSKMSLDDIEFLMRELGDRKKFHEANSKFYELAPLILSGYKPESLFSLADQVIRVIDAPSKVFIASAQRELREALLGDISRVDALLEEVSAQSVGQCIGLHSELMERWDHALDRLRAKMLFGWKDGGLHGQLRTTFRKVYDDSMKSMLRQLKQQKTDSSFKEVFSRILRGNEVAQKASKKAKRHLEHLLNAYWEEIFDRTNEEIKRLWVSWQQEVGKLVLSVQKALNAGGYEKLNPSKCGSSLFKQKLKAKVMDLTSLSKSLRDSLEIGLDSACYGYSLLQKNARFPFDLEDGVISEHIVESTEASSELLEDKSECIVQCPGDVRQEAPYNEVSHEELVKKTDLKKNHQKISGFRPIAALELKRRPSKFLSDEESKKLQSRDAFHNPKKRQKQK